ncbi:HlyD family secretion protein [Brockia lithotrophica]|uniref:HlyD family secretion protein n=1 Tax=Brockia lithotrophica TaxID=933949 RepID=A0A660LA99_9BACL|nr:HlyD family efflux transporter periplasmic adaptor subunit [Brockia lithotrophica]RKQ88883.1 HlyD family secretion protein [Brockia lithotrophica]
MRRLFRIVSFVPEKSRLFVRRLGETLRVWLSRARESSRLRRAAVSVAFVVAVLALSAGAYVLLVGHVQADTPQGFTVEGIVQQREVRLSFLVGGRLAELSVGLGDEVKEGQVLARLDDQDLKTKLERAQAAVAQAEAAVRKAQEGKTLTDAQTAAVLAQVQAKVAQAQAKYNALKSGPRPEEIAMLEAKLAAATTVYEQAVSARDTLAKALEETTKLVQMGKADPATLTELSLKLDEAKAKVAQAEAEKRATEEQLALARKGVRKEELDAAQAQLEEAQAALRQAQAGRDQVKLADADVALAEGKLAEARAAVKEVEDYLAHTVLTAPFDGQVVRKFVEPFEVVGQGMPVLTLADPREKWADFYVPEDRIANVRVGDRVTVWVEGKEVPGSVVAVSGAPQFAVRKATNHLHETDLRSYLVRVKLPADVRAGATARWEVR